MNKTYKQLLVKCFLVISVIVILVYIIDINDLLSGWGVPVHHLNSDLWAIIIALISSFIAGGLTLLGVKVTLDEQHSQQMEENRKLVMPMLWLEEDTYDERRRNISFDLEPTDENKQEKNISRSAALSLKITNVGARELRHMHLADFESKDFKAHTKCCDIYPMIYSRDSCVINLCFYDSDAVTDKHPPMNSDISFNCYYQDCLDTWYYQTANITLLLSSATDAAPGDPALNISFEKIEIYSEPIEIDRDNLPWNKYNIKKREQNKP